VQTCALPILYVAFAALAIGATMGLLQVLERTGSFQLPSWLGYYQVLTVHGVILGLVLTTFFIIGFMFAAQSVTTGGYSNKERTAGWIGFIMMLEIGRASCRERVAAWAV